MIKLESVSNTGEVTTTRISALSQLFVAVFAATVSLSLPVMVFAQQQPQSAIERRMTKTITNERENNMGQPGTARETPAEGTNQ